MDDNTVLSYKLANQDQFWKPSFGLPRLTPEVIAYFRTLDDILAPITSRLLFQRD